MVHLQPMEEITLGDLSVCDCSRLAHARLFVTVGSLDRKFCLEEAEGGVCDLFLCFPCAHTRKQVVEKVIAALKLSYPKLRNGDRVTPARKGVLSEGGMVA